MRKYRLPDTATRERVAEALRALEGWTERPEQSCAYRLDFVDGPQRAVVKQYTNGTLLLQPATPAGPLLARLVQTVEGAGGAAGQGRAPGAPGVAGEAAPKGATKGATATGPRGASLDVDVEHPFDAPWIGTDEAGKGDYFGPLVAAAVYVEPRTLALLETLGVRDSKRLSDAQNRRLAGEVRAVCGDRCAEVLVPPERYNTLYAEFRREGKNLNTLLAWGHARAIQTVLERVTCDNVIVDQFADARYLRSRLEARSRTGHLNVVQVPRAERNLAVAAASVLARDRFLGWLEWASRELGQTLPKGASSAVEVMARALVSSQGPDVLNRVAKLHFKTTERVLSSQHH